MDGKRLCCLFIPDFQLQVLHGDSGLPPETPSMVVTPGQSQAEPSRIKVTAANPAAKEAGVQVGMGLVGAQLACPDAAVFDVDEPLCERINVGILLALCKRLPTVEAAAGGEFYIGLKGMGLLYESETHILEAVVEVPTQEGFAAVAAIASNRFTARGVAQAIAMGILSPRHAIVPTGAEAEALAPLPLQLLPTARRLIEGMHPLGLETMGAFAALDSRSVERRYGEEGVALHRLARGEDNDHINGFRPLPAWSDSLDLDHPIMAAQGIVFLLSPLVVNLMRKLTHEGRACVAMNLKMTLEDRGEVNVPLNVAAPTEHSKVLVDLLRLKLEKTSLCSGVVGLEVEITDATAPTRSQQDLFARIQSGTGLAATVARLRNKIGHHAVTKAHLTDSYLPKERFVLQAATPTAKGVTAPGAPPLATEPAGALRCFQRDRPIRIDVNGAGRPTTLFMGSHRRAITQSFGPLRYDGAWWKGSGFGRDYHRVLLDGDADLLIYREHTSGEWYLEGVYD